MTDAGLFRSRKDLAEAEARPNLSAVSLVDIVGEPADTSAPFGPKTRLLVFRLRALGRGRCGRPHAPQQDQSLSEVDSVQPSALKPGARHNARQLVATPSERRVARLAAQGRTNRQIAETLFVTRRTIETHLSHTYQNSTSNRAKNLMLRSPRLDRTRTLL